MVPKTQTKSHSIEWLLFVYFYDLELHINCSWAYNCYFC